MDNNDGITVEEMYEFLKSLIKEGKSNYKLLLEVGDENYFSTEIQIYDKENVVNIL